MHIQGTYKKKLYITMDYVQKKNCSKNVCKNIVIKI